MLEYLSFEYCKETEESHAFKLQLSDDGYYYLQTLHGRLGNYINIEDCIKNYRMETEKLFLLSNALESKRIYSWKKVYPDGYIPEDHIMGCDVESWSLDYKECEKRYTRHIHGKGNIYDTFPEVQLLPIFDLLFPDFNFIKWISEESE